jgi:hypothetical protein
VLEHLDQPGLGALARRLGAVAGSMRWTLVKIAVCAARAWP